MPTQIEVCNQALDKIGSEAITSLADSSPRAEALARNFDKALETILAEHQWNFAKWRATLVATTTPAFEWAYAYTLPEDFVSLVQLNGVDFSGDVSDFCELEGGVLLTDEATAEIQYIRKPLVQVATPTFSPVPGSYASPQPVAIACTTAGVTIRYTLDGTTAPSRTVGTIYTAPLVLTVDTTIKAIAYKTRMIDSEIATGVYDITSGGGT